MTWVTYNSYPSATFNTKAIFGSCVARFCCVVRLILDVFPRLMSYLVFKEPGHGLGLPARPPPKACNHRASGEPSNTICVWHSVSINSRAPIQQATVLETERQQTTLAVRRFDESSKQKPISSTQLLWNYLYYSTFADLQHKCPSS